jgi:F-type H+-transporting ATPase subunit delta
VIAGVVARRYAKALQEIGTETGSLDQLVTEMSSAADAYASSDELQTSLENPLFPYAIKKQITTELAVALGLGATATNTLLLLGDRRRMRYLPGIAKLLREIADKKKGILRAEVVTAAPLSDAYYQKLQAQLERMTGQRVIVDRREDPSIIAGVVTRIGDTVYDGSLRTRLDEMKHALLPTST